MAYRISDKCAVCGACEMYCPEGAISFGDNGIYVIDEKKCKDCGKCAEVCRLKAPERCE